MATPYEFPSVASGSNVRLSIVPMFFASGFAASSTAKPLGMWTLAAILVVSFGAVGAGAIMVTAWLDRHRHSEATTARILMGQEEKTRSH